VTIRIRTELEGGVATVHAFIKHPMETGNRKNPSGKTIPAHFIREVVCLHEDRQVLAAHWGPGISRNPYLSFRFAGAKAGERLVLRWEDNQGGRDSVEVVL
jgi:sulfur-oxidizing protein SoxZ